MKDLIERENIIGFANELEQRALKLSNNDSKNLLYKTVRATITAICEYCEKLPPIQPEQAVKGCRNCKYGKYNDHWKTHFCYNPNECTEWNLWEPSAQSERLKGHWIIDGHHVQCSVCAETMCNTDREGDKIPMNFCSNCGADMRGEQIKELLETDVVTVFEVLKAAHDKIKEWSKRSEQDE